MNIVRVRDRPDRVHVEARSGREWICLFDPDPMGTIWTAWIEGDFDSVSPSGFTTNDQSWLGFYEAQLNRWSETFSSMGWLLTKTIPEDKAWTLG